MAPGMRLGSSDMLADSSASTQKTGDNSLLALVMLQSEKAQNVLLHNSTATAQDTFAGGLLP